ncbi:MAG: alkyl hydroperoxide reductase/Thiol specific antioxidant/Mal allergen [bacterium]|nr:MAG: alkyl hydroperoxide reductase/Thiol specific antioxidant/Mal allergen [bacterium]
MNHSTTVRAALLALALGTLTSATMADDQAPPSQTKVAPAAVATPDAPSKPAMARPDEPVLPIGSMVPDFTLKTVDGKEINLTSYRGESVTVLTFLSKNCPVSRAWHKEIATIAAEYEKKGVKFLGLMSNSTEKIAEVAPFLVGEGIKFPVVDDPGNVVADRLDAIGTPHLYIIDKSGKVVYSGAIDDSTREPGKVTKPYFRTALASVVAGQPVAEPSPNAFIGCTIKRVAKT